MRTVILILAINLGDLVGAYQKVHGIYEPTPAYVIRFFAWVFLACIIMDLIEFFHKVTKPIEMKIKKDSENG